MKVPEFDKHLKKAGGHIGQNVENNNKDEDSSPKTLNDKNHQASSRKFRQLTVIPSYTQILTKQKCTWTEKFISGVGDFFTNGIKALQHQ